LNFITLPFKLTRIHDCTIATIQISPFDASMPNLENRDARNGNSAEKEMLLDEFPVSFRWHFAASPGARLCHSFALESALALRRRLEIPSQAMNRDGRECSAGRPRLVPAPQILARSVNPRNETESFRLGKCVWLLLWLTRRPSTDSESRLWAAVSRRGARERFAVRFSFASSRTAQAHLRRRALADERACK
jgi:hypothetical protein